MIGSGNTRTGTLAVPLLIAAGVLSGTSYLFMQSFLAWVSFIPLFIALEKRSAKGSFLSCTLYGILTASLLYYWVIPVATRYAGTLTLSSFLLYGGVVLYFSLYSGIFGIGYHFLHTRSGSRVLAGASIAGLYVLLEWLRMTLLPGSPWCHYTLACSQAQNTWVIQWAAVGGHAIIAFAIVLFSYVAAQFLITREVVLLFAAGVVFMLVLGGGCLLIAVNDEIGGDRFCAVLLNENFSAETRWHDRTGDSLAHILFALNHEAAQYDPDLIVWSETAVPWTLEPDEEFIPKALSLTRRSRAAHLVGMWSPAVPSGDRVYNSAYLIGNDGRIEERHDKTILLDFLERPFNGGVGSVLPLLNTSRYSHILPGRSLPVLASGKARIGVLICNESLSERLYATYAEANANLLVVMSNDAWFEGTPLQTHHFYITRIMAVMMGMDVVVNSNRGMVGVIRCTGDIDALPPSDSSRVVNCAARLSAKPTLYRTIRGSTVPLTVLLVGLSIVRRRRYHETCITHVPGRFECPLERHCVCHWRVRHVEMEE